MLSHDTSSFVAPDADTRLRLLVDLESTELANSSYYRSRIITSKLGVNPLVTLGQPLLAVLVRITRDVMPPTPEQFRETLHHELKTFESRSLAQGYSRDEVILGRFLLCVAIEQSLTAHQWYTPNQLTEAAIFPELEHHDSLLYVLDKISADPQRYLALLELAYLSISLGAAQRFWHPDHGEISIDDLLDQLYSLIRIQRGDQRRQLLLTPIYESPKSAENYSLKKMAIIATIILSVFYAGFNYMLQLENGFSITENSVTKSTTHEHI